MNMKTTKFLAVLAVLAMAFAAVAIVNDSNVDANTGSATITNVYSNEEGTTLLTESELNVKTNDTWYVKGTASISGGAITIASGATLKILPVTSDAGTPALTIGAATVTGTLEVSTVPIKVTGAVLNAGKITVTGSVGTLILDGADAKITRESATASNGKLEIKASGATGTDGIMQIKNGEVSYQNITTEKIGGDFKNQIIVVGQGKDADTSTAAGTPTTTAVLAHNNITQKFKYDVCAYVGTANQAINITDNTFTCNYEGEAKSTVQIGYNTGKGIGNGTTVTIKGNNFTGINQSVYEDEHSCYKFLTDGLVLGTAAGDSVNVITDATGLRAEFQTDSKITISGNLSFDFMGIRAGEVEISAGNTVSLGGEGIVKTKYSEPSNPSDTGTFSTKAKLSVLGTLKNTGVLTVILPAATGQPEATGYIPKIAVNVESGEVGKNGLTGNGTIVVGYRGSLSVEAGVGGIQTNTNTIKIMNGGTFAPMTGGVFSFTNRIDEDHPLAAFEYVLATFNGSADYKYEAGKWPGFTYDINADITTEAGAITPGFGLAGDVFNLTYLSTITISGGVVIPEKVTLNVVEGSTVDVSAVGASVTNNGTIKFASGDLVFNFTNGDNGVVEIAGEDAEVVNDATADTITAAAKDNDEVIATVTTGIEGAIDIKKSETTILFTAPQNALNIKMAAEGELNLKTAGDAKLTGTISVDGANVELKDVTGNIQIVKGSVWITGDIHAGTLEIAENQTLVLDDTVIADEDDVTIILNEGSKLVLNGTYVYIGAINEETEVASGDLIIKTKTANTTAKFNIEEGTTVVALAGITIGENDKSAIKTTVDGNIKVYGTLTNYKVMNLYGKLEGDVTNNGEIVLYTGADITLADITGTGKITDKSDESEMSDIYVNGDSDSGDITFPATQNVIVDKSWNLINNANVSIKGQLVIPEGTKMTVEAGASLTILNGAKVIVEGTLIIEESEGTKDAGLFSVVYGTIDVYGTLTMNGKLIVDGTAQEAAIVNITETGTAVLGKASETVVDSDSSLNVISGASLTIKGALDADSIYNYGTITVATEIPATGASTIYMRSSGASVVIQKFTVEDPSDGLTITDQGLVYYYDKSAKLAYAVGYNSTTSGYGDCQYRSSSSGSLKTAIPPINTVYITATVSEDDFVAVVSGLTITENVKTSSSDVRTYYIAASETGYTSSMSVSGNVATSKVYTGTGSAPASAMQYGLVDIAGLQGINVLANETLAIDVYTTIANYGKFTVSGTADLDAVSVTPAKTATFNNNGTVTVSGDGLLSTNAAVSNTVNACKIEEMIESRTYYEYYGIDAMLALVSSVTTVTEFDVLGSNTVSKSATLPDGVTMTLASGATVTIGSATNNGITLTIEDEAVVKGSGTIDVKASLYAKDKSVLKGNEIKSDVYSCQVDEKGRAVKNGWALWTNVVTALNTADVGDIITIGRENTDGETFVTITGNVEVKTGVTLVVPEDMAPLLLNDGVTLTVNGILATAEDIYAYTMFDVIASNNAGPDKGDKSSAIVVNGALITEKKYNYDYNAKTPKTTSQNTAMTAGAPIAGAYYETDDGYVISSIEVAMLDIEDVIGKITVNGIVKADSVTFSATDNCTTMEIGLGIISGDKCIIPTSLIVNTLVLDGTKLTTTATAASAESYSIFSGTVTNLAGSVTMFDVTQQLSTAAAEKTFTIEDKSGKLTLSGSYYLEEEDSVLAVSAGSVYSNGITVDTVKDTDNKFRTRMAVAEGAELIANDETSGSIKDLIVYGGLSVPNATAMTVGTLVVMGELDIAAATSSKTSGTFTVTDLFVGIDEIAFNYNALASEAAVLGTFTLNNKAIIAAGSTLDLAAMAVLADLDYYTDIIVEGIDWFSAFAKGNTTPITVNYVHIDDADLKGWASYEGGSPIDFDASEQKTEYFKFNIGAYDELYAVMDYNIYDVIIYTDAGVKSVSIDGIELFNQQTNQFILPGGSKLVAGTHAVTYTMKDGYSGTPTLKTFNGTLLKDYKFITTGTDSADRNVVLQLNGTEPTPEPEPVVPEKESEWTITTILLCVLVVLIAIMAVIVALRLNRN